MAHPVKLSTVTFTLCLDTSVPRPPSSHDTPCCACPNTRHEPDSSPFHKQSCVKHSFSGDKPVHLPTNICGGIMTPVNETLASYSEVFMLIASFIYLAVGNIKDCRTH